MRAAARGGHENVVWFLAKCPQYPTSQAELADCLIEASGRNLGLVEFLLGEITTFSHNTSNALSRAIVKNQPKIIERLLRDPRINISSCRGLSFACDLGQEEVAFMLLDDARGITVEAKSEAVARALKLEKPKVLLRLLADPMVTSAVGKYFGRKNLFPCSKSTPDFSENPPWIFQKTQKTQKNHQKSTSPSKCNHKDPPLISSSFCFFSSLTSTLYFAPPFVISLKFVK